MSEMDTEPSLVTENESKNGGKEVTPTDAANDSLESEETEERKPGIFEQSPIVEGKRQRKKTEFLTQSINQELKAQEAKKEVTVPEGQGVALGDVPYISAMITKKKAEDLVLLHRLCFGSTGQTSTRRKNLRKFKGFDFPKDGKEYEKKAEFVSRIFISGLKNICEIFGLEKGGTKETLQTRVMDFCMKPNDQGKPVPGPKQKSRKSGEKRKTPSKAQPKAKRAKKEADEEEDEDSEEDADEEESASEEEEEEEEVKPTKKSKPAPKKDKEPRKKSPPKKSPQKKSSKKVQESESDGSDDEPLLKQGPPTDDQLKSIIKKILDKANLEEVTMKTVCQQVYDKFPGHNLTPKKEFIKGVVKELLRQA